MADPDINLPDGFELCKDGKCGDADYAPLDGKKQAVSCKPSDKCGGKGCACRLFRRKKKDAKKNKKWDFQPTYDGNHEADEKDIERYDYQCYCVKPVLDDDDLKLCEGKTCVVKKYGNTAVECKGDCGDDCECRLFKLKKPEDDPPDGKKPDKWKHVPTDGKAKPFDKDFYYLCFCIKK